MNINFRQVARGLLRGYRVVQRLQRESDRARKGPSTSTTARDRPDSRHSPSRPSSSVRSEGGLSGEYPGDFRGRVPVAYAPDPDGEPDPGEIVWTWVPYEEDHSRGKDRPVLIVGRQEPYLLVLMLTSKDRNNATSSDRDYLDIGTGAWDREGRPSEVKLDRVIRVRPEDVRREGAVLPRDRFETVAQRLEGRG
ncbi:type II toxin-antitoxin system PemK/MazF family toxin [Kocuria sp. p3-SID1433]|uniref:type II toxin-antitoxin system PemK/MazF family toxin n=1 Tax=unclassified Kocuria TaxID=2649579 RepID=UPI0021A38D08|nr:MULTISPECIES: type II toxin-antitoxin system PemK/MazF family toxin [unclassified Kocuria]MCT1600726.1 type II toxin-antitoxin system PemK/MazF family toxin [Kocuria sp. p3-SID1428]MCT2178961.1 type II toxin-antitoxin system PemK/MazF family toxin [Kocuria sp. p3-SID1433]